MHLSWVCCPWSWPYCGSSPVHTAKETCLNMDNIYHAHSQFIEKEKEWGVHADGDTARQFLVSCWLGRRALMVWLCAMTLTHNSQLLPFYSQILCTQNSHGVEHVQINTLHILIKAYYLSNGVKQHHDPRVEVSLWKCTATNDLAETFFYNYQT